jgi:DNA-binding NarL/FixJ family response regulator
MKGTEILKWGLGLWIGYKILKEIDSTSQASSRNLEPNPRNILANPDIKGILEEAFIKNFGKPILLAPQPQQVKLVPDPNTVESGNWLKLIRHPSVTVILGGRGKGKSALGYRLLEHLRWTASPYAVGLPENARKLLPDWVGMATSLEDVPPKAIVLVDEAYMPFHARSSMAAEAKAMSQLINLSRQREQTLIFVSQESRQIDRNIASSANVIIFKDLGLLQLKFDRRELTDITTQAKQALTTVNGDKKKWAYVYAPDSDFVGLIENSLPSFWSEKLGHIFATGEEITSRPPKKTPLSQRILKAKKFKQQGLSLGQIAKLMGVSKGTIKNWLDNYPYKR